MYSHFAAVRAFMVSGASVKAATIKSSIAYSFFTTKSSEKTKWNESVLEFFFLFFLFLFFSRRTSTPDIQDSYRVKVSGWLSFDGVFLLGILTNTLEHSTVFAVLSFVLDTTQCRITRIIFSSDIVNFCTNNGPTASTKMSPFYPLSRINIVTEVKLEKF